MTRGSFVAIYPMRGAPNTRWAFDRPLMGVVEGWLSPMGVVEGWLSPTEPGTCAAEQNTHFYADSICNLFFNSHVLRTILMFSYPNERNRGVHVYIWIRGVYIWI